MKEDLKEEVYNKIKESLVNRIERNVLQSILDIVAISLDGFRLEKDTKEIVIYDHSNEKILKKFIVSKAVEGLSERSIKTYNTVITVFLKSCKKRISDITTDDIRVYLAYKKINNASGNYINLIRRALSSLFQWCVDNEELTINPVNKIKSIRIEKKLRTSLSEDEMEILRFKAKTIRNKAIIEFLYSTGCRVSEMCNANRSDIDFVNGRVTVLGKGKKYRNVYLSPRCKSILKEYLDSRNDEDVALFVANPYLFGRNEKISKITRLTPSGVEVMLRNLGKKCGIENVHPHRFRRTAATLALKRGMPIEQVQKMLGHESIETTTIYAQSNMEDVQAAHNKYVI